MKARAVVARATLKRSGRAKAFSFALLLSALAVSTTLLSAYPSLARGTVSPGSLPSWNSAVSCTALLATIEGVIGNQVNANGGATYGGGGFQPGNPNKRSTSPPCSVNGNTTFVEVHGILLSSYTIEDCVPYPNGTFCDTTANIIDPNCTNSDVYLCRIHVEIDQAWKSAGIAPQNPPGTNQLLDIQGFVFWENGHDADQWHSYSGWELHALTAWRLSGGMTASFSYSPTSPSTGTQVSFTATASGGTQPYSFSWSFGDSSSGTGSTVTHTYTKSGSYNVALTVKDSSSPQQTAASQQTVTVTSPPPPPLTASFTFSPASPTTGQQVTFTASASGGTAPYSFNWNFGDKSTGTGSSTTHTYGKAGTFTITLTVKDGGSAQQTTNSQQSIKVSNSPPPSLTAGFTFSPSNPYVGQTVSFTGSASGGTTPYSYSWTFGDSGTASGSSTSHSYQAPGGYTVVLTVADSGGQTASSTQTVTVSTPPPAALTASFSYTPASPLVGQQVTFTASVSGGTAPYSFSWSFGDGSTDSGSTVTHAYSSAGTFNVILTASDGGSPQQTANSQESVTVTSPPPPLNASFSYSPTSPQVGQQISFSGSASGGTSPYTFSWNLGDGTSGTGATTTHTYSTAGTFNVVLTVTDAGGQTTSSTQTVTVSNPPPPTLTASFSYVPTSPSVGQQITFTGSASGGTVPYSFTWDFGDGTSGTGSSATHAYSSPGTFNVVLTVSDGGSPQQTSTSQNPITVTSPSPSLAASFTFTPTSPQAGQQITFVASGSGGTTPYTFSWTFGDGSSGVGSTVTHSYTSAGTYAVTLTVTDSGSPPQTVTSQRSITVTSPPPPPLTASFTFSPTSPNVGQAVSFTGSASGGVSPYNYVWNFGDGGTGSGNSVSHAFQSSGTYTVMLTITDSSGQTTTSSQIITVSSPLSASISYSPSNPTPLTPVAFTGSATGGTGPYTYSWDFGDGTTGTGSSVSHAYLLPGTYTVTLTVTDANGQTTTSTATITVSLPLV